MLYGPPLEDKFIIKEKAFLAGGFVCTVGYGIQLVMYVKCALYLWGQRKIRGRISLFLLIYITVLLTLSTAFVFTGTWIVVDMYVDNRSYPGGPWAYSLAKQNALPGNVINTTTGFLLTYLSDLLMLWRCWVVWNSSGRLVAFVVTAIPGTAILVSFVLGILWACIWRASHSEMTYGTAYCATSLGGNILLTLLIVFRLVLHRQRILSTLPPQYAAHYFSLAAIIIESAALYAVFGFAYIITYAIKAPIYPLFLPLALTSQQIAGYLIILRVAHGRAWNLDPLSHVPQRSSESRLTSLNFNAPVFSSHIDMDQEPMGIELGDPRSSSTLLAGSSSSSKDVR